MKDPNLIYVVDDDHDIRQVLRELLEMEGYRVMTAGNGREALELLSGQIIPGLILLDLMMPEMSGWEFMKAAGRRSRTADIPILVDDGGSGGNPARNRPRGAEKAAESGSAAGGSERVLRAAAKPTRMGELMIALYNFEPKFCPNCGRTAAHEKIRQGHFQYELRWSYSCDCGLLYQRATTRSLIDAAGESEGNLPEKLPVVHAKAS